jgi:hypothetical protein
MFRSGLAFLGLLAAVLVDHWFFLLVQEFTGPDVQKGVRKARLFEAFHFSRRS